MHDKTWQTHSTFLRSPWPFGRRDSAQPIPDGRLLSAGGLAQNPTGGPRSVKQRAMHRRRAPGALLSYYLALFVLAILLDVGRGSHEEPDCAVLEAINLPPIGDSVFRTSVSWPPLSSECPTPCRQMLHCVPAHLSTCQALPIPDTASCRDNNPGRFKTTNYDSPVGASEYFRCPAL